MVGDQGQVVGDQQHGHVVFALQFAQKTQDLSLHGHIEGGGGLVGDQQLGLAGQRHGDHDPLALPAGELVGIGLHALGRRGDTDPVQQFHHLRSCGLRVQTTVQAQTLGDLVTHAKHGVQAGHGFLEDHCNLAATQLAHGFFWLGQQVLAIKQDLAADTAGLRWWQQTHHRQRGHAFATTRLAHQAQCFTGGELQRNAVKHRMGAAGCAQAQAQVSDVEQGWRQLVHLRNDDSIWPRKTLVASHQGRDH